MLSEKSIKEFAVKWQTTEQNVAREYFQHVFLAAFYQRPKTDKFAFKGGTSLRLLYNSPRFSEDLDFTGTASEYLCRQLIDETVIALKNEGADVDISESKSTSGGWFSIIQTVVHSWPVRVELNISLRRKSVLHSQTMLISPMIVPSYTVIALNEDVLVEEKINALLTRKKPRDFFDLYYILRSRLAVNIVAQYQPRLIDCMQFCNDKTFAGELKMFLPRSYWSIINNLSDSLKKELGRF